MITTIFGVLIGAMSLGQMAPGLTALGEAKQAGYRVFETLERVPPIDASSLEGAAPGHVEGRLELREVRVYWSVGVWSLTHGVVEVLYHLRFF